MQALALPAKRWSLFPMSSANVHADPPVRSYVPFIVVIMLPAAGLIVSGGSLYWLLGVPVAFIASPRLAWGLTGVSIAALLAKILIPQVSFDRIFFMGAFGLIFVFFLLGDAIRTFKKGEPLHGFWRRYGRAFRSSLLLAVAALVAPLAFRSSSLLDSALWAAVLLVFARLVDVPPATSKTSWRAALAAASLLLVSTALGLGTVELVARILWDRDPPGTPYMADPKTIWTLAPNADALFPFPEMNTKYRYQISPQGLRDRVFGSKAEGEYRIAFVGDSFTYGVGSNLEDTLPKTLERLLAEGTESNTSVLNLGVTGYSPWQERIRLNEIGFGFDPDLVILQLYVANDLDGSLEETGEWLRTYHFIWKTMVSMFQHQGQWQVRTERWLYDHSGFYQGVVKRLRWRKTIVHLLDDLRFVQPSALAELPQAAPRPDHLEPDITPTYPALEKAWGQFEANILAIRDDCQSRGIPLIVFCVPESAALIDDWWAAHLTQVRDGSKYDRGKALRRAEAFLKERSIPHVRFTTRIRRHPNPKALYYQLDRHLTKEGNRFYAETLRDFIMQENLLNAPAGDPP